MGIEIRTVVVEGPGGPLEVLLQGTGPAVVMIPSLGRGAGDFEDLAARLAEGGHTAVRPQPRGFGASTATLEGLTMARLAEDVAVVVRELDVAPATIVGHAFGNRVARMTATVHPEIVESVVLLACGGRFPPAPEHGRALHDVFDRSLDDDARHAAVETAFFAPGNDASVWFEGWDASVAVAQAAATATTPVEVWWEAGDADVLVVHPADDVIALPANADDIVESLGDRATLVTIDGAGHALLPEQPDAVAETLLDWLGRRVR